MRYRGHVTYLKVEINKTVQGLYSGGQGVRNDFAYEDCIIAASNGTINFRATTTQGTGNSVTRVTGLYPGPCLHTGIMEASISGKAGTKTDCIQALKTGSAIGGTGCIKIDIGHDKAAANAGGYAAQNSLFVGPIQAAPSTKSPIHELMPKTGTQAHWAHASPRRLSEDAGDRRRRAASGQQDQRRARRALATGLELGRVRHDVTSITGD